MESTMLWTCVGGFAALLTSFGFVPQVTKMWKSQSVEDVSIVTFYQFWAGAACWLAYGIHLQDLVIIFANSAILLTLFVGVVLYYQIRKKKRKTLSN